MNKIIITGFMGSGKSTVARALAQLLSCRMIDLDDVIESEEGRSARTIIEEDGEPRFREVEQRVLAKLLQDSSKQVLALGGGAWTLKANREQIRERGATSIWLDAPFDLCWKRIAAIAEERPLATNKPAAHKLFSDRIRCYELADLRVAVTEQESATEIAEEIVQALARHSKEVKQLESD